MKRQVKKWMLRLTATGLLITALLLVIILNPILTYANNTKHNTYTIFHQQPLDPAFLPRLDAATALVSKSECYNPTLHLDICLNDGSTYPQLMKALRGQAFAWGFYNKVVLQGNANCATNYVELNGYRWNLTQLLAHEITHCLQFDKLGLLAAKPIADIPDWKWEGYAEYVSRQAPGQTNLTENINRLMAGAEDSWEVSFADGTIAPKEYYRYWLLVQYCMDVKKMNYTQVLADTTSELVLHQEMMQWYKATQ